MLRRNLIVSFGLMAGMLAGCHKPTAEKRDDQKMWIPLNVQGNWVLTDVNPPESVSAFSIQAITFNSDQTYVARILKDANRFETVRGTYRYDEWSHRLYLHSGPDQRDYSAMIWFGKELRLGSSAAQGQTVTAILARSNLRVIPDVVPLERRGR